MPRGTLLFSLHGSDIPRFLGSFVTQRLRGLHFSVEKQYPIRLIRRISLSLPVHLSDDS